MFIPYFFPFFIIQDHVGRVAIWVMPMMWRTSRSPHVHLVEDEEEYVMGGLGSVFLLNAAESREDDSLIVVR